MKLTGDWRRAHKLFSTWVAVFWSSVLGYVAENPTAAQDAWNAIPTEIRPELPHWVRMAVAIATVFFTWLGARLIQQKKPS